MKLKPPQPTESGNFGSTQEFGVSQHPIIAELLSSSVYSDPARATVRELITNAVDAATNQVFVTLPTVLAPTLIVADDGPGMSPEQLSTVYTQYFESDKRDSNTQVGGFGIGAKSPLAVVDCFTVTTQGRQYAVTKAPGEWPRLSVISENTDPQTPGTIIEVTLHDSARWDVNYAAIKTLPWLAEYAQSKGVALTVYGGDNSPPSYCWRTCLVPTPSPLHSDENCLVMGGVAYTLPAFPQTPERGFILHAPVGAYPPTLSRERLQLSTQDQTALITQIQALETELAQEIQATLDQAPVYAEATRRLKTLKDLYGFLPVPQTPYNHQGQPVSVGRLNIAAEQLIPKDGTLFSVHYSRRARTPKFRAVDSYAHFSMDPEKLADTFVYATPPPTAKPFSRAGVVKALADQRARPGLFLVGPESSVAPVLARLGLTLTDVLNLTNAAYPMRQPQASQPQARAPQARTTLKALYQSELRTVAPRLDEWYQPALYTLPTHAGKVAEPKYPGLTLDMVRLHAPEVLGSSALIVLTPKSLPARQTPPYPPAIPALVKEIKDRLKRFNPEEHYQAQAFLAWKATAQDVLNVVYLAPAKALALWLAEKDQHAVKYHDPKLCALATTSLSQALNLSTPETEVNYPPYEFPKHLVRLYPVLPLLSRMAYRQDMANILQRLDDAL